MPFSPNENYIGKTPEHSDIKQIVGKFDTQQAAQQIDINTSAVVPDIATLPLNVYVPSTFNDSTNVWVDYQGNNNSSAYRGNPTYNTGSSSNNATNITEWVQGNTSAGIRFSHTSTDNNYTGIWVTRYNGTEKRIWEGSGGNWLTGFWSGAAPVAHHEGWLTDQTDRAGTSWIVGVTQRNYFRGYYNGSNYGGTGGSGSANYWTINYHSTRTEYSDWCVYGFWYWNTTLGSTERDQAVSFIKDLVGVS
jgi:hypothetical protein